MESSQGKVDRVPSRDASNILNDKSWLYETEHCGVVALLEGTHGLVEQQPYDYLVLP